MTVVAEAHHGDGEGGELNPNCDMNGQDDDDDDDVDDDSGVADDGDGVADGGDDGTVNSDLDECCDANIDSCGMIRIIVIVLV